MQSVCLAHSEKAGLDLAPSGLLNHTSVLRWARWPSKAHIFTSEMSTDGHIRAGCYGSQSRRPEKPVVSRLPLGGAQNPNLKRGSLGPGPGPWLLFPAGCLGPRRPCGQPHPEDPTPPRAWKEQIYLWSSDHLYDRSSIFLEILILCWKPVKWPLW